MTGGIQIGTESPKRPQRSRRRRHPARRTRRATAAASGVVLVGLTATIGLTSAGDISAETSPLPASSNASTNRAVRGSGTARTLERLRWLCRIHR